MPQVFTDPKEMKQDFSFLANSQKNREMFKHMQDNARGTETEGMVIPAGCQLVREEVEGKGFNLALILSSEEVVLYYCRVVHVEDTELGIKGVTQSLVWRNRMKPAYKKATQDFVAEVFNKYLIEQYTVIVSDVYHSYGGMFMWQEQLSLAIERLDREVYIYDQMKATMELINKQGFNSFIDSLWSEDESKLNIRALIKKRGVS